MDIKNCKISECVRNHRCEALGLILLAIATVLTIVTLNAFGIAAMFLVGLVMCCHKHLRGCGCCSKCCNTSCCDEQSSSCGTSAETTKKTSKK